MAKIISGTINELVDFIDITVIEDKGMPAVWICPHCRKNNRTGQYADDILFENLIYLEHCDHCSFVHCWKLKLSDTFKKKCVEFLLDVAEKNKRSDINR